jgi:hypothetical protein
MTSPTIRADTDVGFFVRPNSSAEVFGQCDDPMLGKVSIQLRGITQREVRRPL